ncbi:MAG: DUF2520 domain-containing protein [Gammaproteobacteria bacterium]|nr:DUF2520 domain-containing protein [Gammaproteobacteria bacterium]
MTKPAVALIGAGSAGTAMAVALHREGYPIAAVSSRSVESAQRCGSLVDCEHTGTDPTDASRQAEIIIISTPDNAIETTCQTMADSGGFRNGQLVLHLSGALTSDALNAARAAGADTLSLHPAQTMVEPLRGADLLKKAWFCLEGNDSAVTRGRDIANDLSGNTIVIDKDKKALYHAALSFSSNYLTTVEAIAIEMLTETGISRQNALALIMPLIQGSVDTLANCGLPDALTGPVSRGDAKTIEKHLCAMRQGPESHLQIYKMLGLEALKLARAKGKMAQGREEMIQNLLINNT